MADSRRVSLPVSHNVESLLLWRDPVKSAVIFSALTAAYFILEWSSYSLITIQATVLLILVGASFVWANLASFLNKPGPPVPTVLREGVTEGQLKSFVERVTPAINQVLGIANRVFTGKDVLLSFKVFLGLYALAKLGGWFSVVGWLYFAVVLAFSVPKLYEAKKPEIDAAAANAQKRTQAIYEQHVAPHVARIPRASTATPAKAARPTTAEDVKLQ